MQWMMLQQDKPQDYVIAKGVQCSVRYAMIATLRIRNVTVTACSGFRPVTSYIRMLTKYICLERGGRLGKQQSWLVQFPGVFCNDFCE